MAMSSSFHSTLTTEVEDLADRYSLDVGRAFVVWYAVKAFRLDENESLDALVDGGNDRGVDLLYVDDEAERVVVVQGKFLKNESRTARPADLALLLNTPNELSEPQELRNAGRADLADAAEDLLEARSRGFGLQLHFIYPGKASDELERMTRNFNRKNIADSISVAILPLSDLELISDDYAGKAGRIPKAEISIVPGSWFEHHGSWGRSLVVTLPGTTLRELHQDFQSRLFDQNVRLFLGSRKGSVNAGIRDTLSDAGDRANFWAYNNGITIVARSYERLTDDRVELRDFSIVNGCQTTVSVAEASEAAAKKATVLGRIVAADSPLIEKIIRFTNSQTPINIWDLSARDSLQQRLRRQLDEMEQPWFYALRRGEFESVSDKGKYGKHGARRVLKFPLSAQYLAAVRGLAVEAYKDKARLFTAHRDQVFPNDVRAPDLVWAWTIGEIAEWAIHEYRTRMDPDENVEAILRRGTRFFVAAVMAQLLRLRNGEDFMANVDANRVLDKAMRRRLEKYGLLAVFYYVSIMRSMIEVGGDLGVLLRNTETTQKIEQRVKERYLEEMLAPQALDEKLPILPEIAKA